MGSPIYRTLSRAKIQRSLIEPPWAVSGASLAVTTALTPGRRSALLVSMRMIRACAWGLRSTFPWSRPGSCTSSPKIAFPVTLTSASMGVMPFPTTLYSGMVVVPRARVHVDPNLAGPTVQDALEFGLLYISRPQLQAHYRPATARPQEERSRARRGAVDTAPGAR